MKLFLPDNLFASFFKKLIVNEKIDEVIFLSSSQISGALEKDENAIGLIPTCDLLTKHDMFISSKLGIAFDGLISSSYFYLGNNFGGEAHVNIYGDVTSNDLILSKILMSERYDIDIELVLSTKQRDDSIENFLICGKENFINNLFERGISFADQVSEYINLPYVNFIIASMNKEQIEDINVRSANIDLKLEDEINSFLNSEEISETAKQFVQMNIRSVYFELTENEKEALQEIIKLPYYHGMIKEIHELNYV